MRIVRRAGFLGLLLGLSALIALTVWSGAGLVRDALATAGVGIVLVVLVRAVTATLAAAGWWVLFAPDARPGFLTCLGLRFVREGANTLLPFGQVGGDAIGARLLAFHGVPAALATASIIVDVFVLAVTQLLFALTGLVAFLWIGDGDTVGREAVISATFLGTLIAVPALAGFWLAQREGGRRAVRWFFARFRGAWARRASHRLDRLFTDIAALHAGHGRIAASFVLHWLDWMTGLLEVYIGLALMGSPVTLAEALVIESLTHAIRGAAFAIPGAFGAQEGGLVVLCGLFGIPPDRAMALSLLKRVADLATGLPGLLAWQWMESRRWRRSSLEDGNSKG